MGKKKKEKKEKKEARRRRADAGAASATPRIAERTLCKWSEADIEAHLAVLGDLVAGPRYVCRRCARSARRKKNLCKPVALESA